MSDRCFFGKSTGRRSIVGVVVCVGVLATSVAFGQGGGRGGAERRTSPSDHYRGNAPPSPQIVLTLHGGQYLTTDTNRYELVIMPLQTRIYAYDKSMKPISARDLRVQMSLQLPDERKARKIGFQYVIMPAGAGQDYLVAVFDVALLKDKDTPITLEFSNLPDPRRPTASFTPVFSPDKVRPYVARVLPTKADAESILRQRICPVSGDVFGSRGPVVKLLVGDYTLFVCCEECIAAVKETPDKYLPQQAPTAGR
jgi:hypothetical protein